MCKYGKVYLPNHQLRSLQWPFSVVALIAPANADISYSIYLIVQCRLRWHPDLSRVAEDHGVAEKSLDAFPPTNQYNANILYRRSLFAYFEEFQLQYRSIFYRFVGGEIIIVVVGSNRAKLTQNCIPIGK